LIETGLSNKEIAVRLHVAVCRVKNHVHHLLAKLQVGSRAEAAGRLGLRSANHTSVLAPAGMNLYVRCNHWRHSAQLIV
jgi:hypothetical protein